MCSLLLFNFFFAGKLVSDFCHPGPEEKPQHIHNNKWLLQGRRKQKQSGRSGYCLTTFLPILVKGHQDTICHDFIIIIYQANLGLPY